MTPPLPFPARRLAPLAFLLAAGACAQPDLRDDMPGRAQAFPPVHEQTVIPGGGERRTWSQIQAEQSRAGPGRPDANSDSPEYRLACHWAYSSCPGIQWYWFCGRLQFFR